MLVFVLGMGDNNFMAGAQEGVTFALKTNKFKNKNVPWVGAQQQIKNSL